MAEEPEVLREQIRETQESLATKISTLEDKVVGTVNNTTEAVAETVESVKETVTETVEAVKETVSETVESVKEKVAETIQTVKRTFDIEHHVREHPWPMMAGACAAGFLTGHLLPSATRSAEEFVSRMSSQERQSRSQYASSAATSNGDARNGQESWLGSLFHQFHDEIEHVKGVALGTLFGLARDWATQNLPEKLSPHVQEVIDNITTKLGGTRIEEPVMENR